MAKEINLWVCGDCGYEHEDEYSSQDCCKPEIIEKIIYACEKCGARFPNEHNANECCANQTLDNFEKVGKENFGVSGRMGR